MQPRPDHRIVLASASPRRRRLLRWLGVPYDVVSADIAEDLSREVDPVTLTRDIAAEKAVAARKASGADELTVACDTIVVREGAVLGKPRDLDDARRMLRELSGGTHQVVTGVAVLQAGEERPATFAVVSDVKMRVLSEVDIEAWAAKGELLGCAGAYNIESHLATVEDTECFQNVAGLPLCHLWRELASGAFGEVPGLQEPCGACEAARGVACRLGREITGMRG